MRTKTCASGFIGKLTCVAALAAGCATAPPPPPEPALFVADPVDLLPHLGAAVVVNVPRLRQESELYGRILEHVLGQQTKPEDLSAIRFLAEHAETVMVGVGPELGDDPDLLVVVRTRGARLLDDAGRMLGTQTEVGPGGFRRATLSGDDLVMVDDYTAVIFEPGLRTAMGAVLARQPGRRFREEAPFRGLAREVAFGSAPVALLGHLPPGTLEHLVDKVPPAMLPLARAMGGVETYGGQLELAKTCDLKVVLRGASSNSIGLLAGVVLVLKSALMGNTDNPEVARMATNLQVEARDQVLTLTYSLTRAELWQRLEAWLSAQEAPGEGEATPDGQEI